MTDFFLEIVKNILSILAKEKIYTKYEKRCLIMKLQEQQMVKCQICGKEYTFDNNRIEIVNGVKGIRCTDSCGAFIEIKENNSVSHEQQHLRCKKCATPLDISSIQHSVLECPHCHEKMTFPKDGQTKDVIDLLNLGQRKLSICKFNDAYNYFNEALSLDPTEPEAYFGKLLSEYNIQYLRDFSHYKKDRTITLQPICHRENIQSIRGDYNYKKAIELATNDQSKVYEKKIQEIEDIQEKFLKLEKEGKDYDCFICVKVREDDEVHYTNDSYYAGLLYDELKENGYRPFYSEKIKKADWLGNAYEANILYGLYKAKCMIIICSDKKYLDTPWMKNEYSRYIEFMKIGKKEKYSLCISYTDEIIEQLPGISDRLEGIKFDGFDTSNKLSEFVEKYCYESTKHGAIESIKIEYGSVAKRAKRVNQNDIEYYELGENCKTKATNDEKEKLSIAIQFLKNGLFPDAKRHLSNIVKKNPDNGDARIYLLLAENKISSINEILKENRKEKVMPLLDRFDQGVKTCTKEIGMRVIKTFDKLCRKCAGTNEVNNAEAFFRFVIRYNYPGNNALRDFFLQYLMNSSQSMDEVYEKYELFKQYISYIDNDDVNKHIEYRLKMEESLIKNRCFDYAKKLNREIDEIVEGNIDNFWNAIFIETKSKDYEWFTYFGCVDENIYTIFEKILKYCMDKKQYCDEVDKFIKTAFMDLNDKNYSSKLEIFNRAIKYYPPDSVPNIVNNLRQMIDCLIEARKYEDAIHYSDIYLTYMNDDYHIYWKIVLCKLGVSNNEEAIKNTVSIRKIPEFSIVLNYARYDQEFINQCIDVVKKQEIYYKEKLKNAQNNLELAESNKKTLEAKKTSLNREKEQTKKLKILIFMYYLGVLIIFFTFEFLHMFFEVKYNNGQFKTIYLVLLAIFPIINDVFILIEPIIRKVTYFYNMKYKQKRLFFYSDQECHSILILSIFIMFLDLVWLYIQLWTDFGELYFSSYNAKMAIITISISILKLIPWLITLIIDNKGKNTPKQFIKTEQKRIKNEMNNVIADIDDNLFTQDKLKKKIDDLNGIIMKMNDVDKV